MSNVSCSVGALVHEARTRTTEASRTGGGYTSDRADGDSERSWASQHGVVLAARSIMRFAMRMLVIAALATPAAAGTKGGVTMPDQVTVGDKTLVLNGMGLREAT